MRARFWLALRARARRARAYACASVRTVHAHMKEPARVHDGTYTTVNNALARGTRGCGCPIGRALARCDDSQCRRLCAQSCTQTAPEPVARAERRSDRPAPTVHLVDGVDSWSSRSGTRVWLADRLLING
eukprot:6212263-Pleurochrysis_carterae.AAC.1